MSPVIHVVPTVPPEINGLGDYAHQLWKHWPEPELEWHILAIRVPEGASDRWPGAQFHRIGANRSSLVGTLTQIGSDAVVLHYVPHAYNPKGVPGWLPAALAEAKRLRSFRLVVMFHELFAVAAPWRITGWLAPTSVLILRRLCSITDAAITNCELYAKQLRVYGGLKAPLKVQAVGNNLSGSKAVPFEFDRDLNRPWSIAVFGQPGSRSMALERHKPLLRELDGRGMLKVVKLLGAAGPVAVSGAPRAIDRSGVCDDELIAELQDCDLALIHTDSDRFGKSGVAAAACWNGCVPVLPQGRQRLPSAGLAYNTKKPKDALQILQTTELWEEICRQCSNHVHESSWSAIAKAFAETVRTCP